VTADQTSSTPGFCERAWAETADLQEAICHHPFNQALALGSLEPERFAYYLVQDARYLREFSTALAGAAARAPTSGDAGFFAASAERARAVEGSLHARYLDRLLPPEAGRRIPTGPACRRYAEFLRRAVEVEAYPVLVASLLPCFWIYHHVGLEIARQTDGQPAHPYREWIDTYADPAFAAGVDGIKAIADRQAAALPDQEEPMLDAFRAGSEHEWAFWDGAWQYGGQTGGGGDSGTG